MCPLNFLACMLKNPNMIHKIIVLFLQRYARFGNRVRRYSFDVGWLATHIKAMMDSKKASTEQNDHAKIWFYYSS